MGFPDEKPNSSSDTPKNVQKTHKNVNLMSQNIQQRHTSPPLGPDAQTFQFATPNNHPYQSHPPVNSFQPSAPPLVPPHYQPNNYYQPQPQPQLAPQSYPPRQQPYAFSHPVAVGAPNIVQMPQPYLARNTMPWTTDLFGCFDDPLNTLVTFCFPCVTFGQVAEILDNGGTSCATSAIFYTCIWYFTGCPCLISCTYRTKLRARYELVESPAPDWITHFFCEFCALCQAYRELKNRGVDPSIGWHANAARQQQQIGMAVMVPPINQTMMA